MGLISFIFYISDVNHDMIALPFHLCSFALSCQQYFTLHDQEEKSEFYREIVFTDTLQLEEESFATKYFPINIIG